MFALCEVPLPNGRRADMMAIDAQGAADHRRDQGVARRPDRRPEMDRLSRLLRPFLLGGADRIRPRPVRRRRPRPGLRRADRRRPLRRRGGPRGAATGRSPPPAARPRPCASPAAPRGGWPAISIRGWPGWTERTVAAGYCDAAPVSSSSRRIARAMVLPGIIDRANSRRHCRSGWDRRRRLSSSRTIGRSRRWTAKMSGVSPRLLPRLGLAPAGQQQLGALVPADLGGEDQRRGAVIALQVGPGARAEQEGQPGEVAAAHQDVQRAFAGRRFAGVDDRGRARASARSPLDRGAVALAHRLQEGVALGKALRRDRTPRARATHRRRALKPFVLRIVLKFPASIRLDRRALAKQGWSLS